MNNIERLKDFHKNLGRLITKIESDTLACKEDIESYQIITVFEEIFTQLVTNSDKLVELQKILNISPETIQTITELNETNKRIEESKRIAKEERKLKTEKDIHDAMEQYGLINETYWIIIGPKEGVDKEIMEEPIDVSLIA